MLFASFDFLLFFAPVLLLYWIARGTIRARWSLLLVASYFFYAASAKPTGGGLPTPWYFVGLLVASTLLDYCAALIIASAPRPAFRRHVGLGASLIGNLGLLAYFKYTGFALRAGGDIAGVLGLPWSAGVFETALPIGISFYTFQSLSYTIDVYRGQLSAERSLLRFSLFVSFFPQLVAGPIVRASEFLPQLRKPLRVDAEDVNFAVHRILKGLLKKVILGDFIAAYFTDVVFTSPDDYSSLENLLALYAFTLQIYADFSGYSDIAIGIARLLGFRLPENFDRPYQARDVAEFWRRWHMTLSTWLRDYLFFPLGGSRGSSGRVYFNLWLTMFLVGMWHGASWNFVVYGNLQALAMLYNRYNRQRASTGVEGVGLGPLSVSGVAACLVAVLGVFVLELDTVAGLWLGGAAGAVALLNSLLPRARTAPWTIPLHVLLSFHFTTLSRVFFRADDLEHASAMVGKLVHWDGFGVRPGLFRIQGMFTWVEHHQAWLGGLAPALSLLAHNGIALLLACGLAYHFTPADWTERLGTRAVRALPAPALGLALGMVAALVAHALDGPRANIYFAF